MFLLEELAANQATVLKSGDDVKNPKERIQHLGRALQELHLIQIEDGHYSLTAQGLSYYEAFDPHIWKLSHDQVQLLRDYLSSVRWNEEEASNLAKVINIAISLAEELVHLHPRAIQNGFHHSDEHAGRVGKRNPRESDPFHVELARGAWLR